MTFQKHSGKLTTMKTKPVIVIKIEPVNADVAKAINHLTQLLTRDYGSDWSYTILGEGCILAQSNIHGVYPPVDIDQPPAAKDGG